MPNIFIDSSSPHDSITVWSWNFGEPSSGASNTDNNQNPLHTYANAGTYTINLTVTTAFGCSGNISHPINVDPKPHAVFSVPDVCVNQSVLFVNNSTITAPSTMTYVWNFGDGNISNATAPNHTYLNPGTDTVRLVVTSNNGCLDSTKQAILVKSKPTIIFDADVMEGCEPLCVQFHDLSTNVSGVITNRKWYFGDNTISTLQDPQHCYTKAGVYSVRLVDYANSSCADSLTKTNLITVHSLPKANFTYEPNPATIFAPQIHFNNNSTGGQTYDWDFGDFATSTLQNPLHTYPSIEASYEAQLIVTNADNCTDMITVTVIIGKDFSFYIPNSFTPNNDDTNDKFYGQGDGILAYEIDIYDRGGLPVYHSNTWPVGDSGWNGRLNNSGFPVNEDVYAYKVKVVDVFNKKHVFTGHVTLYR